MAQFDYFNPAGRGGTDVMGIYNQAQQNALVQNLANQQNPMASDEFQRLKVLNPERAAQLMQLSGVEDDARMSAMLQDAKRAQLMLANGDEQGAMGLLAERAQMVSQLGGNPRDTMEIYNQIRSGESQQAMQGLQNFISVFDPNFQKGKSQNVQSSKILEDGTIIQVMKGGGSQVVAPDGSTLRGDEARQAIRNANEYERDKKREEARLSRETAMVKERTKGIAEREKASIDNGLTAAQTMPTLTRAMKLLDFVETGRPQAAMAWAKKQFGIQDADEVELTNLLGKRILQQLKPIFGAQFTVKEGEWLKSMETDFGSSTEANRRLIQTGMQLAQERARQGIEAAQDAGDERTIRNINDWLNFEIQSTVEEQAQRQSSNISEQEIRDKAKNEYGIEL